MLARRHRAELVRARDDSKFAVYKYPILEYASLMEVSTPTHERIDAETGLPMISAVPSSVFYRNLMEYKATKLIREANASGIEGIWLCGGAIVDTIIGIEPKDFDLYFSSAETMQSFVCFLKNKGIVKVGGDEMLPTFTGNLQLIGYKFYPSCGAVLQDFDLTCCQYGTDGKDIYTPIGNYGLRNEFKISEHYVRSYRTRLIQRIAKYIRKGFKFEATTADILYLTSSVEWEEMLSKKGISVNDYIKEPFRFWQEMYKEYINNNNTADPQGFVSARSKVDYVKMIIAESGNIEIADEVHARIIDILVRRYEFTPIDVLGFTYKLRGA